MKILLSFTLLLATVSAYASMTPETRPRGAIKVLCEHYLDEHASFRGFADFAAARRSNDFAFDYFENASNLAVEQFGFDPMLDRHEASRLHIVIEEDVRGFSLSPVRIRIVQKIAGFSLDVQRIGFPDRNPTLWQDLKLPTDDAAMTYAQIKEAYPIGEQNVSDHALAIGFHTDFDAKGVRKYISFDGLDDIQVGLDVPCSRLLDYIDSPQARRMYQVVTPVTDLCRVPVMNFTRAFAAERDRE